MANQELDYVLEESDFLRKVAAVRSRNDEQILTDKDLLRTASFDKSSQPNEKVLYLSAIYSVIFLWTLLFVAPTFSGLAIGFTYPLISKSNRSEGWRWTGYCVIGLSLIMQIASFF